MKIPKSIQPPIVKLTGPASVKAGTPATWDASASTDPASLALQCAWDVGDTRFRPGMKLEHTFEKVGFHRIGLNVSNGYLTEPAWRDVYVTHEVQELGTEGESQNWLIQDFHDRALSNEQTSRASFRDDAETTLVGKSALQVVIKPYAGFRAALTYPKSGSGSWSLEDKTQLSFWLKAINADVTGWQGGPFIVLHGDGDERSCIEPKPGRDLKREAENNEAREGWRLFEIPLQGNDRWQRDGDLPARPHAVTLAFDSWGAPPLTIWIDGLAIE